MTILLICETAIIEHIFTLVCKKLRVNLTIQKTNSVKEKTVMDGSFVYFEPTTDYDRGYLIAKEVKKANLKSRFPVNRN